jgi:acetyl esterase/lipase
VPQHGAMRTLARVLGYGSALVAVLLVVPSPRGIAGGIAWLPKLWAGAWAPFAAIAGGLGALVGLFRGEGGAVLAGLFGALASVRHTVRLTAEHGEFDAAFGPDWQERIPAELRARLSASRYRLVQPAPPEAVRSADVVIGSWGAGRPLLGDLWRPPAGVSASGLAVVFLHGGLWQALDKDFLSRPLCRRLAGQGHVILDVAYPLAPEADLAQMVDAVGQAVGWLRAHARVNRVRPDRIVLMGAAGGGHLALLAAYASGDPGPDASGATLAPPVRAVVSVSGITDLAAFFVEYGRTNPRQPRSSAGITDDLRPRRRDATMIDRALTKARVFPPYRHGNMPGGPLLLVDLLGGTPDEVPGAYRLGSPIAHVRPGCPPTLQVMGDDDFVVDVSHGRRLHAALLEARVPSALVELPDTVHGFDQYFGVSRRLAPAAQAATYDIERFLALMA